MQHNNNSLNTRTKSNPIIEENDKKKKRIFL